MKKIIFILSFIVLLVSCSCPTSNVKIKQKHYLDKDHTIYHKEDTIRLNNGKTYLKVYGVTYCKYNCPVLIEI